MKRKNTPKDVFSGSIHYSVNAGLFIVTSYITNRKVIVYFFRTGNEGIYNVHQIRKGRILDGRMRLIVSSPLTQKSLKSILYYDEFTGYFKWKITAGKAIKGNIAGTNEKHGYRTITISQKNYRSHRLAWLYMTGEWPKDQVDHINHIRDDNRWINLRDVTRQENLKNSRISKRNKSGHTGVHFSKRDNKFMASICINSRLKALGYFDNLIDAVIARKMAEYENDFHSNHGEIK